MTQHNRETLLALADRWTQDGIDGAVHARLKNPWGRGARSCLAHAANCFTVAASLRATASSLEVVK